jgi:hypothetical protein
MRLGDAYIEHIKSLFVNSDFKDKKWTTIRETLHGNFPKSETPMLVQPDWIDIEEKDELTTKVTFSWEDYSFSFFMNWEKGQRLDNYVLRNVILAAKPETIQG